MINFLKKLLPKSSTKTDLVNNSNASAIAKEQQPKAGFLKSFDEARDKFKAKTNLKSLAQNKRAFQQQIGSKNNNKRSRYIVLSISTIISLLLATPLVIDNSGLKSQLELKIGDKIKANITIQNVEIALFPSPKIVMNNVAIQNFVKDGNIYDLMAGAIEIKTGFFAILLRKFNLKELNFYNAALSGYDQLSQSGDRKNFAIDALNKTGSNNFTTSSDSLSIFSLNGIANQNLGFSHIPRINIYNLNFITHDQFSKEKRFDQGCSSRA